MYPHRIRLRGPWECEPLARADGAPLPPPGRVTVPWRCDFPGRVRLRRRFGYPGRIDAHERVWLLLPAIEGAAEVRLNGKPLGPAGGEFEVTPLLRPRNELVVDLTTPGGCVWEGAELEVRCTAFLRGVQVRTDGHALHVSGLVVGTAARPLELYVLRGRSTAAYRTVEAKPSGQPFELVAEGAAPSPGEEAVRVELVNGAVVWYAWEGGR